VCVAPAATLTDEVSDEVKHERLMRVQELLNAQAAQINRDMVGTRQTVLVERPSKRDSNEWAGRTENNRWVNFQGPASLLNHFVEVDVTEAMANSLRGRWLGSLAPVAS
jgi:tRNA-2-methylthio-N6-dimethylallyladenosine synthase